MFKNRTVWGSILYTAINGLVLSIRYSMMSTERTTFISVPYAASVGSNIASALNDWGVVSMHTIFSYIHGH